MTRHNVNLNLRGSLTNTSTTWRSVHAEFLRRIRDGEWRPGHLIPAEIDLAREFGCARGTIGRALTVLADDGIVDRKRKAGTRIAMTPVRRAMLEIPIIRHEIEATGASYLHRVSDREITTPPAPLAARLGLDADARLLRLETLHLADGQPWAFERRWVNPETAPGILDAPLEEISANEWLVRHAFFSRGDLAFRADSGQPAETAMLDLPTASPVFVVDRTTWLNEAPVTVVRLVHPPHYRLTTTL